MVFSFLMTEVFVVMCLFLLVISSQCVGNLEIDVLAFYHIVRNLDVNSCVIESGMPSIGSNLSFNLPIGATNLDAFL